MTIVYVTTGAWGTGTGTPNSAAQVDGNFHDVDQRIVGLTADMAEGKRIDHISYTSNSMTVHYTDGSSEVIPLPIATLSLVGAWTNSTTYLRGNMVATANGIWQVLQDHTTPPLPAPFDPNAVDGSLNPLYQLWVPLRDINYDAAIFVPGSVQRDPDELLWQAVASREMRLPLGDDGAYAHLDVGTGANAITLSIEKNSTEVGTITFASGGGQTGAFSIPADVDFAAGDRYALRITTSTDATPSDLSITLPFIRMGT